MAGPSVPVDEYLVKGERLTVGRMVQALEHDELWVAYQPQFDVHTRAVVGVEALVRWEHPQRGTVSPADFIGIAERGGLIDRITAFVLATGLRDRAQWARAGHDLTLAVNVSPRTLHCSDLPALVATMLRRFDTQASCLVLEVTEGALMRNPKRAANALAELKTAGVGLSLDDFGTGYSSLSRLRRLALDEIKIDRSFVRELDAPVVKLIAELGAQLGHRVVAEGVEHERDLATLRSFGCHAAQGFALARPMPAAALLTWLAEHPVAAAAQDPGADPGASEHAAEAALVTLGELGRELAGGLGDPRAALCAAIGEIAQPSVVALWEPSPDKDALVVTHSSGLAGDAARVSLGDKRSGVVAAFRSRRATFIVDVQEHALSSPRLAIDFDASSVLWQPLVCRGRGIGALTIAWADPRPYLPTHVRTAVAAAAGHASAILGSAPARLVTVARAS